jgi:hypothetical protein
VPNASRAYFFTKASGAAGDVLDYFTAGDAIFPQGSTAYSLGLNSHPLVCHPEAKDAFIDFPGVVYPSGFVVVHLFWSATAVLGDVQWQLSWERDNPPALFVPGVDLNIDSFAAAQTTLSPAPTVLGRLQEAAVLFTPAEMDDVVVGNPYRLRIRRQGGMAPDNMTGDALLFRISLQAP